MDKKISKLIAIVMVCALMIAFAPSGVQPAQAVVSTSLVISQVYGGAGTSGNYLYDYIEIKNIGSTAVDLSGYTLQYTSAAGTGNFGASTTQLTDLPAVNLQPGQYYLVHESAGSAGTSITADLTDPTPINMSGTAGKVALVSGSSSLGCNGGSTPCNATQLARIVDLVGYGATANFYESAAAPAPSTTTAIFRAGNGCTDTDNNSSDFGPAAATPAPRNTSTSYTSCSTPSGINLSINDVTLAEGNSGTVLFTFTINLSAPAGVGGVTFDIATQDNTATDANNDYEINTLPGQTIAAGNDTYNFSVTVNGDTNVEANETFYVNVTNVVGANVSKGQGTGTITNDDISITYIHDVQGNGSSTPIPGASVTVEAIVVGDYQTQGTSQIKGFFLQEEDADADADPATSEGIFVYCNTCTTAVSVGDKVQVTGTVSEFSGMTEITPGTVSVISTSNPLPTEASITLPVPGVPTGDLAAATTVINAYYEQFEGMLASFPAELYVSEYFELARYGQVELTQGGRMFTFTGVNDPSASGYIDHQIEMAKRMIVLDDTDNRQNRPVDVPNTAYFFPTPGLSTSNFFRGGDTITGLTGVLDYYASAWRVRPVTEAYTYTFTPVNTRPAVPSSSGRLIVASFNVLNYFLSPDTANTCGPTMDQDCRGADTVDELNTQRTKLLAALTEIDADVFGFMEMENTPGVEPLDDIVSGLPGYDYIDTGVIGGDTIRVGIIYKTSTVVPVGSYAILDSSVNPLFDDSRNRPALAQTFEELATGERFTVVVNHLKSKGSSCGVGDDDTTTGQGNCNLTRTNAATALAAWLATDPTGSGDTDYLIIGDLNSYAKEDPITALKSAGYTDLVNLFGGASAYGYVFDGQLGYLDHALANASLKPQVADVHEWHINADEIPLFDYNDDVKDTGESAFEEESDTLSLYNTHQYRTSDHDPVIIGLDLDQTPPSVTVPADITVEATSSMGAIVNFSASANDNVDGTLTPSCIPSSGSIFPIGATVVTCSATDAAGNTGFDFFNVMVEDTTAPSLTLPADITTEATSAAGAVVNYIVTANDLVDVSPTINCSPASGSTFGLGTTMVSCTATDDYSNTSTAQTFNVTVQDTTDPSLGLPADITAEATSAAGASVSYIVTSSDLVDADPTVSCSPASGATFPLGTTPVNCSATDDSGNSTNGSFNVTVQDTTDPILALPADMIVAQNTPSGAVVNFIVTAADTVDASPTVVCTPPSGSTFPLGTTPVNCSATDDYNNTASGSFNITVVVPLTATYTTVGAYDGTLIEVSELSDIGAAPNISGGFLDAGDMVMDRQVMSLMHFNTATLPDGAVVVGITLQLKRYQIVGTNPFGILGDLNVDIASPYFGPEMALKATDFQATASGSSVGIFNPVPLAGNWYEAVLDPAAFPYLNLTGTTQFRIHFTIDDNDDLQNDFIRFFSGNAPIVAYRPILVVSYYMP